MYPAHLIPSKLRIFSVALAVAIPNGAALRVDFDQLVSRPDIYKGKRVVVEGVAGIDGTSFTLFQPSQRALSRTIFVGQKLGKPRYNKLDNHWVRLTGIVDADKDKIFACKIFLEDVQSLPRPPEPSSRVMGIFLNEGPNTVELELFNNAGELDTSVTMSPNRIEKTAVVPGVAKVYKPGESLFTGKLLSSCPLPSEKTAPEFFDASERTFYLRIRSGKIVLLKPKEATDVVKRLHTIEK